jgi:excisionase family DNA binding protein
MLTGNEEILTRDEAADFLKCPKKTLDYWVATGQVPFSRIGARGVRFRKNRLMQYLEEREGLPYHRPTKKGGTE